MNTLGLVTRAFKILRNEGPVSLFWSSTQPIKSELRTLVGRNRWFQYRTCIRYWLQQYQYDAPAHPYKIIKVNPAVVDYQVHDILKGDGLGQIKGGEWDYDAISNYEKYEGLRQRFEEDRDWEETEYYQSRKEKIKQRGGWGGYEDMDQFKAVRCKYVDELFDNICQEGYRPNYEGEHSLPSQDGRHDKIEQSFEPLVAIGQDGEIYWKDGWHRFAIARALGIERIPVNVIARHREWQEIREEIYNTSISELRPELRKYLHHPDLNDVIADSEVDIGNYYIC